MIKIRVKETHNIHLLQLHAQKFGRVCVGGSLLSDYFIRALGGPLLVTFEASKSGTYSLPIAKTDGKFDIDADTPEGLYKAMQLFEQPIRKKITEYIYIQDKTAYIGGVAVSSDLLKEIQKHIDD